MPVAVEDASGFRGLADEVFAPRDEPEVVGLPHPRLLPLQYSGEQIEAMKIVKRRVDPHWLLGQGTLFSA